MADELQHLWCMLIMEREVEITNMQFELMASMMCADYGNMVIWRRK